MKTRLVLLAACAAVMVVGQEREKPPAGGAPKPFKVPPRQMITLPNGLKASIVNYGTIPQAVVSVVIRAGNAHEAADQVAVADLTANLMQEGAGARNAAELAAAAASMGGSISAAVGMEDTTFTIQVLSEFAPQAVALLSDVVQRPKFPAGELPRLKEDMARRFAVARSNPQTVASELFREALYGEHAYGRPLPSDPQLRGYTMEQVQRFYSEQFGAQRTHVYVAGVFDAAAVRKAVTEQFSGWKKGPGIVVATPQATAKRQLITSDRPNAPQSTLRIGLPVPPMSHRDYIPLAVADRLLGGAFTSRITSNLRENKGFTYSPGSVIERYPKVAHWVHNSDVTAASTGAAMTEIFNEVNGVHRESPPVPELKGHQEQIGGRFVITNSTPAGIIAQLAVIDANGLDDAWLNSYVQNVHAVKPSDIQRMAEMYLNPNKMTVVVVGDMSKVKEQVEPFRAKE